MSARRAHHSEIRVLAEDGRQNHDEFEHPRRHAPELAEKHAIADSLAKVDRPYLRGEHLYERARILAALGDTDGAVRALQAAHARGTRWPSIELHVDRCWDPIRNHVAFVELMKPKGWDNLFYGKDDFAPSRLQRFASCGVRSSPHDGFSEMFGISARAPWLTALRASSGRG